MANPKHPDSETHTNEDLTWLAGVELICKTEHISFEVIFVKRSKPCACCPCLCSLLLPPLLQPHGSACKGQQPEGPATPACPPTALTGSKTLLPLPLCLPKPKS